MRSPSGHVGVAAGRLAHDLKDGILLGRVPAALERLREPVAGGQQGTGDISLLVAGARLAEQLA
jgi:hypothetical protein